MDKLKMKEFGKKVKKEAFINSTLSFSETTAWFKLSLPFHLHFSPSKQALTNTFIDIT